MSAPNQQGGRKSSRVRSLARVAALLGVALLPAALIAGDVSPLGVVAGGTDTRPPSPAQDGTPGQDDYGASGQVPHNSSIDPRLLAQFRDTQSLVPNAGVRALVPNGSLGIPGIPLDAYHRAERAEARLDPSCGVDWAVLASIGRIESNHARDGAVDAHGTTVTPILGPELSGADGNAAILDSDGGQFDGDTTWDRAVGPMQFIPSTWRTYETDGNGDGVASPHNVYDATQAAAKYLCAEGGDLRDPAQLAMAVFRYNHSDWYVETVLAWAAAYRSGVVPVLPDHIGPVTPVHPGPGELPPPAPPVLAMPAPAPGQPPAPGEPPAPGQPTSNGSSGQPAPPPTQQTPATTASPPSSPPPPPPQTTTPPPSTTTTTPPPPTTTPPPTSTTPTCPGPPPNSPTPTTTPSPTTTPPPPGCPTPTPSTPTGQAPSNSSPDASRPPSTTQSQLPAR